MSLHRINLRRDTARALTDLPFLGPGRVFNSRTIPLRRDLLPAARVWIDSDELENQSTLHNAGLFTGDLRLVVQIVCEDAADPALADRLDLYCDAAIARLLTDPEWMCHTDLVRSVSTAISTDATGEMRVAVGTVVLALRYGTHIPLAIPDALERVLLEIDAIDPAADPNTTSPPADVPGGYPGGAPGPEGRIEVSVPIDLPQLPEPPTP